MKTCEEMARSVMVRAKAYKRRKCWIMSTSAAACICCLILGIVLWGGPKNDQPVTQLQQNPTTSTKNPETLPKDIGTSRITFMSATGNETVAMSKDVRLPLHMEMRKFDCSGLTEAEEKELIKSEEAYAKNIIEATGVSDSGGQGYHYGRFNEGNTLITYIVAGHIIFGVGDPAELESMYLETGGAIQLLLVDSWEYDGDLFDEWRYYMDSETIMRQSWAPHGNMAINWIPDATEMTGYGENMPIDLSKFSDYIKIVVTFKDGTVEEHQIDIFITEDGKTSAIYRGQTETI